MSKIIREKIPAGRIALICRALGVNRTTVLAAIDRGEIPVTQTCDGYDLVAPADVRAWMSQSRQPGPRKSTAVE